MVSVAVTVPPVMFNPVRILAITAAFESVTSAAPGPEPDASPVSEVM